MVLILDGNSGIGAQLRRNLFCLICLRHKLYRGKSQIGFLFSIKTFFLNSCEIGLAFLGILYIKTIYSLHFNNNLQWLCSEVSGISPIENCLHGPGMSQYPLPGINSTMLYRWTLEAAQNQLYWFPRYWSGCCTESWKYWKFQCSVLRKSKFFSI